MIIRKHKFLRIGDEFPLLVLWLFYSGMMIDKPYLSLAISGGVPCFGIRVMLEVFVLETEGDFGMPSEHAAFVMYLFSQPVRKKDLEHLGKRKTDGKTDQPSPVQGTWDHDCTTPAIVGLFDGLDAFYC